MNHEEESRPLLAEEEEEDSEQRTGDRAETDVYLE